MYNIEIRVITPIIVVNFPNFLDLVQPDKDIKTVKDIIPKSNVSPAIVDGIVKSPFVILRGNPFVVIIKIFVIANTEIKKKLAAETAAFIIFLDKEVFVSETNKFATTAIEKPPNNELISIIWFASLFQYSNVISSI